MKPLALAFALSIGISACGVCAQEGSTAAPEKPLTYEIVSIKVNKSESGMTMWNSTSSGVKMENVLLRDLVSAAFGLNSPMDEQVVGLPKWAEDTHFDVEAKVSDEELEAYKKLNIEQQATLLLAALEDRFKLKAHEEVRELPTYSLEIAKGGPRIRRSREGDSYVNGLKFNDKPSGPGTLSIKMNGSTFIAEFQAVPTKNLADNLSYEVHRQVTDNTGLTGKYDIKLSWSPDDAKDSAVPGIFTALQEQLGLKLVPTKGPVECVIVDHVDEPTEN